MKIKPRDNRRWKGEGRILRAQSRLAEDQYEKETPYFSPLV